MIQVFREKTSLVKKVILKRSEPIKQHWSLMAFTFGFILDLFTLNRIDQRLDLGILLAHFSLITIWICLWHLNKSRKKKIQKLTLFKRIAQYAPIGIQFSFGALFSGFIIFYTKSASIWVSWPFLIVLYLLFFGNEKFRHFYRGLFFQISLYYFSLFTLLIFLLPVVLKKMGWIIFLLSGIISLIIITIFLWFLIKTFHVIRGIDKTRVSLIIGGIYCFITGLYFENIIPPIPLSLKTDGIYYDIYRNESLNYSTVGPKWSFWERFLPTQTVEKNPNQRIYYFSSIFAPTDLDTEIIHRWELLNPITERWERFYEKSYPILGGRAKGYRGYTYLKNPPYGTWRVLLKTKRGQTLGIKKFYLVEPKDNLETEAKQF